MSEWMTIDSAPKDGTSILVFMDGSFFEAYWTECGWRFPFADAHGCGCCQGDSDQPTYWKELPEAPK